MNINMTLTHAKCGMSLSRNIDIDVPYIGPRNTEDIAIASAFDLVDKHELKWQQGPRLCEVESKINKWIKEGSWP